MLTQTNKSSCYKVKSFSKLKKLEICVTCIYRLEKKVPDGMRLKEQSMDPENPYSLFIERWCHCMKKIIQSNGNVFYLFVSSIDDER